jgi:hypothetical protein
MAVKQLIVSYNNDQKMHQMNVYLYGHYYRFRLSIFYLA